MTKKVMKTKKKTKAMTKKEIEETKKQLQKILLTSGEQLHALLHMTDTIYSPDFKQVLAVLMERCKQKDKYNESEQLSSELLKKMNGKDLSCCILAMTFCLTSVMSSKEPVALMEQIKRDKKITHYIQ